jgi:hypothetical protein
MSFAAEWMELEMIRLIEINQSHKKNKKIMLYLKTQLIQKYYKISVIMISSSLRNHYLPRK